MFASLPMYQRPELIEAHDEYWRLISQRLGQPIPLTTSGDEADLWLNPKLLLSQTCGMPFRLFLHNKVTLIGTPDYGIKNCPPGYYRSAIITNANDKRQHITEFKDARFAYNDVHSQSGFAAAYFDCQKHAFFFSNQICSGGHQNSAKMVAMRQADIAYIDPVSLNYMEKFDPFYENLRIVGWTDPTPGLPYISALGTSREKIFSAVENAIKALSNNSRILLNLKGIVYIPVENYLNVPSITLTQDVNKA